MNVLEVRGLSSGYGPLQVLHGVDLAVPTGGVAVVVGPNGAGKSTLLATVAGVVAITRGAVHVNGADVTRRSSTKRLRGGLGWVPEGRNVFLHLSVRDNLALSARLAGIRSMFDERVEEVFELFPVLERKFKDSSGSMSGGEQQILALARMLIRRPKVALLDEPTVGLAPVIVDRLAAAVATTKAAGVAWVITEQNLGWLAGIADTAHVMRGGHLREEPDTTLLRSRDAVRRAFFED